MLFHLIIFGFFAFVKSDKYEDFRSDSLESLRLPNNTKPVLYDIHLLTDGHLALSNYSGIVTITIEILEDTNEIVLHADKVIEITKLTLIDQENGAEYENINYTKNPKYDFLIISAKPKILQKGKFVILSIAFNNIYTTEREQYQLKGFYTSAYRDIDNFLVWIPYAMSFFEPVYARMAFPCYDEPTFKAKFSISITHGENFTALSNMAIDGKPIKGENGMVTTKFQQTPLMSSYTVAFVIGNFVNSSVKVGDTILSVYTFPSEIGKQNFTLDIASKALTTLEDYFGIPYKLPKLDHVFLPALENDAMENWGLIIHRAMYNRINGAFSPESVIRLYNAIVVVHETVHQWFGNLVTPKWWNQVWLNEGITDFYTVKILQLFYPESEALEYRLIEKCGEAWSKHENRPMSEYVENESDIWYTLDPIFNCKADKMIRMFEYALTPETFKKGVIKYLQKFKYLNAEENDLFDCLQEAATEDHIPEFEQSGTVKQMMSSWTQQKDYPVINVTRNYADGTFSLLQTPVFSEETNTEKQNDTNNQLWWIPITFTTASDANFNNTTTDFIFPNQSELNVDPSKYKKTLLTDDWLLLNNNQIGVYLVQYDEKNWNLIINTLKKDPKVFSVWSKVQLIRDAYILNSNSYLPLETWYNLISYLKYEDEILPWQEGMTVMIDMKTEMYYRHGDYQYLVQFAKENLIEDVHKKFDNISVGTPIMDIFHKNVNDFLCIVGDECSLG